MARNDNRIAAGNQQDFRFAFDFWREWRQRAKESIQFWRGVQWTEEEGNFLRSKSRPTLVFNKVLQHVDAVTGSQRQNRFGVIVRPVGPEDVEKVPLMQKVLDHIHYTNDYDFSESMAFEDAAITGVGWRSYELDLSDVEGGSEGVLKINHENNLNILLDPNSQRMDVRDAQFVIKSVWLTQSQLIQHYPKKKALIMKRLFAGADESKPDESRRHDFDENSTINNLLINSRRDPDFVDRVNRTVRVVEKWHLVTRIKTFVFDPISQQVAIAPAKKEEREQLELEFPEIQFFQSAEKRVRITTTAQDFLLVDQDAPIQNKHLPFVPIFFYKKDREVFGIVENLKDYNREINKRRSQILASLNKQVNNGWLAKEGTIDEEQWRQNPDIRYVTGDLSNVKELGGAQMPNGIFAYDQYLNEDMQEVGVSRSARGFKEAANESGRLFQQRVQQAALKQQGFFDNWRLASRILNQDVLEAAQQVMKEPRRLRILGEKDSIEFIEINTETFNDITTGRFDMRIDEGAKTTTNREFNNQLLTEMFRVMVEGGVPAQVLPWHFVVENSDLPKKDEISQILQQGLGQGQQQGQQPGAGGPGAIAPVQAQPQGAAAVG